MRCEASRQPFDLAKRSLDHPFEVGHEGLVYRVVRSTKSVKGSGARSIENAEHGEVLLGVGFDAEGITCQTAPETRKAAGDVSLVASCGREEDEVDRSAERVGRNDAIFREANERIRDSAEAEAMTEEIPFLCECAEESCTEIVPLSQEQYEDVRRDSTHFLNAPGHEVAAGPHCKVIERNHTYIVVRKLGAAAEIAENLDPRTTT